MAGAVWFGVMLVPFTVGMEGHDTMWLVASAAVGAALAVSAWAITRRRAERRRYETELASWAAERATEADRARIAADLHDLVSHGLGLITVRASAAQALRGAAGDAERSQALADIERVSRETTTELRRMLVVLRTQGSAPLRPVETLDDLPDIVRSATEAGLDVALEAGELGEVSAGVQLTVCAVVREALHNTLRHAGPTKAWVRLTREADAIVVDVRDRGPSAEWEPHPGAGHGLGGLRERVAVLGGTLEAEPLVRGFRLTAHLPDHEETDGGGAW